MARFDRSWTLFLDRDGVLNTEKVGGYILSWEEFRFEPGALEAVAWLSRIFGRLIVVTNQRCIGKGLLTPAALEAIHQQMHAAIIAAGGRLDAIYYCPDLDDESLCRKPNPGMALAAKRDFPEIDFCRSVMVGNTDSDMAFGRNLGMYRVWIASVTPAPRTEKADEIWPSLHAWALHLWETHRRPQSPIPPSHRLK
ncbi:MAG: HAD-IIIA family hydrolase [Bacteroidetes bacterium]|nr:MAG: HAD-IIIA family hydrolase [Bacteroidota bacterium]